MSRACEELNNSSVNLSWFNIADNSSTVCPLATSDDLIILTILKFFLEGVVRFIISGVGILCNLASIFILTRKELSSLFNQLLVVLVIYDLIYLLTMMMDSMTKLGIEPEIHALIAPYTFYPMNAISMMGSIYMTMAVGMERYIAVNYPMEYTLVVNDASSHRRRLAKYALPITIFSILFNLPKFFETQVVHGEQGSYVEVTELRMSTTYVTWYHNWARFLILGIIPFTVICFLNCKIYCAVKQRRNIARRKPDDNISVVLMMIVASFVICNTLRILLNMHEITVVDEILSCRCSHLGGFPIWILILGFISPVLLVINSSVNFLIYCVFGTKFRQVLYNYIPCHQDGEQDQELASLNMKDESKKGKFKSF